MRGIALEGEMRGVALVLTGALLTACSTGSGVLPTDAAGGAATTVVLTDEFSRWRQDAYEFLEMQVSGDSLEVAVRYAGGCARHDFTLLVSPVFRESYPVQMSGVLAHNAHGDPCRALVGSRLRLDLSPLKEAYRQAYGIASDEIHLDVAGWPERVVYRF